MALVRFTAREWDLVRLLVLTARLPLDARQAVTYRELVVRVGVVTDDEVEALLARLQAAGEEASDDR